MPKKESDYAATNGHIHRWMLQKDGSSKCITSFNGHMCIKILVTQDEYQRRIEEWTNYCELAQASQSKRDYDAMRVAFKYGDKQKMRELLEGISGRAWVDGNYEGYMDEKKYKFDENEYMPTPNYPDPMHPKSYYITT